MTPIQLGPPFEGQVVVVLIVAGAIALSAGVLLRFRVEGSRSAAGGGLIGQAGSAGVAGSDSGTEPGGTEGAAGRPVDAEAAEEERDDGVSTQGEPPQVERAEAEPSGRERRPPELLVAAADRYDRGEYDGSVQAVYMFVRRHVAEELDVAVDGTHWDFFERATGAGDAVRAEPLRALTEVYERAVFGSQPTTADDASAAFELATELADVADPRRA